MRQRAASIERERFRIWESKNREERKVYIARKPVARSGTLGDLNEAVLTKRNTASRVCCLCISVAAAQEAGARRADVFGILEVIDEEHNQAAMDQHSSKPEIAPEDTNEEAHNEADEPSKRASVLARLRGHVGTAVLADAVQGAKYV